MIAWLTDTFIYTGLLIAVVLVLRRPVARHFGPQTAYALWSLPLLRLMTQAYAETHGYPYAEMGTGRFWDELTSAPDAAEDQQSFKVYLPIQVQ